MEIVQRMEKKEMDRDKIGSKTPIVTEKLEGLNSLNLFLKSFCLHDNELVKLIIISIPEQNEAYYILYELSREIKINIYFRFTGTA